MASNKNYVPHHVMVIDTNRCVGCWSCAIACKEVNNEPLGYFWNRVLTTAPNQSTTAKAPASDHLDVPWGTYPNCELAYLPVACQHCNDAPCVKVCPVQATFRRDDGTVLVDYERCIGCRYCMAACPYGARHFNWEEPTIPDQEFNPNTHYLGNRPRTKGVVEKCTFCIQRARAGRYPACVEVCPVGARKFGNLLDKDSEIRYIIEHKRVLVLKEELNTVPRFFYFYAT